MLSECVTPEPNHPISSDTAWNTPSSLFHEFHTVREPRDVSVAGIQGTRSPLTHLLKLDTIDMR